jgi:hypothetical protein
MPVFRLDLRRPLAIFVVASVPLFAGSLFAAEEPPAAAEPSAAKPAERWISLFNGRDLTGWTPKIRYCKVGDNYANTFRVEDGVIKVRYDGYDKFDERFGHLFFNTPYGHYRLRIEYRFVGEQCPGGPGWAIRNSGVMLHGQSPESMREEQDFPVSIEAQFLGGNGRDARPTANVCTPGTHVEINERLIKQHCTNSHSKTIHGDEWVTFEAEVHGAGQIKHFVDGELVFEYARPQLDLKEPDAQKLQQGDDKLIHSGTISLQSESHPIEFRKVELLPLEEETAGK